jgi:5-aminolevulinate synthase
MNQQILQHFIDATNQLKAQNRYREFVDITRICNEFPFAINNKNKQKIIVWCSNDYLAMSQNRNAIDQAKLALDNYGVGSGGTRNISGNHNLITKLETEIAKLHNKESGLVFSSGYVANDATIQALAKIIPSLVIFSDQKNHASIIAGVRNSKLTKYIFQHNNLIDLENKLQQLDINIPKIIIAESVYSMDGDFGNIPAIVELAKKYQALTFIDEVHAVGLYGDNGAGLCRQWQIENEIDIIQGTFAKAFGVIGGYIAGKKAVIDAIRSFASGFIFSTSMPPSIISAIMANVDHLKNSNHERIIHQANVKLLKKKLSDAQIPIVCKDSHIISIRIGDALKAKLISQKLLNDFNLYIQHINYPTVDYGDERLRITISPLHSEEMINQLIDALKICLNNQQCN